jgi:hypothetical protein
MDLRGNATGPTVGALVRCPSCREALVEPGRVCFDCKKRASKPREERREERLQKSRGLVAPRAPRPAETATHRRIEGSGRRWR